MSLSIEMDILDKDRALVEQLLNPDTTAMGFNALVKTYSEPLYWHIRKIVYDHEDADDVLQNTLEKVFKNLKSFRGDSKLYTWLYRIATNEALNFIEKKRKYLGLNISDYQLSKVEQLESDVYFDGSAIEIALQKAIAKLPEKQKLVFNMKYFDDMKYEDISAILGTSVGALKASYHHAVNKIKNELEI